MSAVVAAQVAASGSETSQSMLRGVSVVITVNAVICVLAAVVLAG